MFSNKQAKVSAVIVISLILAILIGLFIVSAAYRVSGTPGTFFDKVCGMNLGIKDSMASGTLRYTIPVVACNQYETLQILDATDYSKCPEIYYGNEKKCAAYQITYLLNRCWWMAGEGDYDIGFRDSDLFSMASLEEVGTLGTATIFHPKASVPCYTYRVDNFDGFINSRDLREIMSENAELDFIGSEDPRCMLVWNAGETERGDNMFIFWTDGALTNAEYAWEVAKDVWDEAADTVSCGASYVTFGLVGNCEEEEEFCYQQDFITLET